MPDYYIGLISGTSLDAVDAALIEIEDDSPRLVQALSHPLPTKLRSELLDLCQPGDNEIERLGRADTWLGEVLAEAVAELLSIAGIPADQIQAIGSHGQTVRHRPRGEHPFTLQLGDPNRLAELTGITTVADLRRRDLAVGGEAAPLVPAFHAAVFSHDKTPRIILNLGGIANLTLLAPGSPVSGFDTGPANTLMDSWIQQQRNEAFDRNGDWAASGKVNDHLLALLLTDDYLQQLPPKSTGREHYHLGWLNEKLQGLSLSAEDVQATLCEFSAVSVANAVTRFADPAADWEVFACGGGTHNAYLMTRLAEHLAPLRLGTTAELGVEADWVEASAFAWLACQTLNHLPGNLPAVTGAKRPVILGGIYPA